ncbi:amidohydrolase family protein [Anaerotignum lactatifermentans]|uniref:Amidohydrolase family protein n=1 Tax=Anaerotignum lactatifermentans TaxID=160404 RepID=A0ABS2GBU5_9FIRM|nr:amidohydrolase family protein [Anaerotignum lactatifermentans]MBM6830441.1 amidohydrolase family protein [Anaerotignum lactatifermentans]MBM6878966.1 amidohydrolase family protein [Anaerotignum lactatifermentans]MBM6952012.1 amidohydrolase family protein [Anaerotignum lactatifermentans]
MKNFVLKGDLCWSRDPQHLESRKNGYLVCENGVSAGVYETLPEKYSAYPLLDYAGKLILPGFTDLHAHAPQYRYRALGMDLELLEWLDTHTFPQEALYQDTAHARKNYARFVEEMRKGPNTRGCIFGTIHRESTEILMELLEESGLAAMVGKVNMDRHSPDILREGTEESAEETIRWIQEVQGKYPHVTPILTPRFLPSCTDALLEKLGKIQKKFHIPVQSHLSENRSEVAWVQELFPQSKNYGDAYDHFGLFGGENCPTIMAHCVLSDDAEIALMKERGVFIAHCPESNTNLASGIAPVRRYLSEEIPMGLGSDIAGGTRCSLFYAMAEAIRVSKLRWRLVDDRLAPLTIPEAFYLATKGGGAFFGKVGSFEEGYLLDAFVLDDSRYDNIGEYTIAERLERAIYLSEDNEVCHKFVEGRQLF